MFCFFFVLDAFICSSVFIFCFYQMINLRGNKGSKKANRLLEDKDLRAACSYSDRHSIPTKINQPPPNHHNSLSFLESTPFPQLANHSVVDIPYSFATSPPQLWLLLPPPSSPAHLSSPSAPESDPCHIVPWTPECLRFDRPCKPDTNSALQLGVCLCWHHATWPPQEQIVDCTPSLCSLC